MFNLYALQPKSMKLYSPCMQYFETETALYLRRSHPLKFFNKITH